MTPPRTVWEGKSEADGSPLRVLILPELQEIVVERDVANPAMGKALWVKIDSEVDPGDYETAVESCILATCGQVTR